MASIRNRALSCALVVAALAALGSPARADVVILKDGTELEGTVIDEVEGDHVKFKTKAGESQTIPWANIKRVRREAATETKAATDHVLLKDGTDIEGTVIEQKEGEYVIVQTASGAKETIPWSEMKRVVLAPGHVVEVKTAPPPPPPPPPATETTAAVSPAADPSTTPRTTFFSMGAGFGTASYSGKYENGTEVGGSGLIIISSLQGGFFVGPSLAIGAGGSFLYMPSPTGERTSTSGTKTTADDVDAAPGGYIGPALRYYPSAPVHLSFVLGYGGMGTSGVFGGTGPAFAPSVGYAFYRNAHYNVGVDANLYVMPLSGAHESGTLIGGGATISLAYL